MPNVNEEVKALSDKYGLDTVQMALIIARGGPQGNGQNVFEQGAVSAADLPEPQPIERLWGFCLYPRSVALLIGETGAGKSSVLYNLLISAALDLDVFGVAWQAGRALNVFYLDQENTGQKRLIKINRLGLGRPERVVFHDGADLSNPDNIQQLTEYCQTHDVDILCIDPLAGMFATINENDNAEAQRQMMSLRNIAEVGPCVLAVHHTEKGAASNYGRGAGARLGAVDVAFMLRTSSLLDGEGDDTFKGESIQRDDILRMQCVKNRLEGRGSLYMQMAGQDKFLPSTFEAWREAFRKTVDPGSITGARLEVENLLADGGTYTRPQIFSALAIEGYGHAAIDAALKMLLHSQMITGLQQLGSKTYIMTAYLYDTPPVAPNYSNANDGFN